MNIKPTDSKAAHWGIYVDGALKHEVPPDLYDSKDTAKVAYERVYGVGRVSVN